MPREYDPGFLANAERASKANERKGMHQRAWDSEVKRRLNARENRGPQKTMSVDELLGKSFRGDTIHAELEDVVEPELPPPEAEPQQRVNPPVPGDVGPDVPASYNFITHTAVIGETRLHLPGQMGTLFGALYRAGTEVVTRQELAKELWGEYQTSMDDTLRLRVHSLRQIIEPDPRNPVLLLTERGIGYTLNVRMK